ncbi:MAG: transcriptional attenuator, LytR family [Chthonomonadaceae bacterium]|nr:transcriptional attenuator, LytR family [Chthonomonadaceae bacterium]
MVKWTFAVGFCLVLVAGGALIGKYGKNRAVQDVIGGMRPGDVLRGDPFASYTPANFLPDHPHTLNLLVLGCDRDYVGKRINGVAVPVPLMNTNGRSDAILIAHYDFDNKTISVLTIPRDTAVHVPGHSTHKINAAHQLGGPALTQETIKDAFGIDTDAFVTLHFEAFEKIVDTVGGVDINVKKQLDYDDNWALLHIHLKPGMQHLTGYQAMGYVRVRHSDSDLMRAERQHEFVEAFRNQIRTPAMLLKGADVLDTITDNLHSSLSMKQLITLANWSKSLPKENITLATMPCVEGPSYVTVNRKPARKMVAQLFFGGNEDGVTITAPDKEALYAMNHRGSRHHTRLHPHDASTDTGSDVPLDAPAPAPDATDATQNDSNTDKQDSPGAMPKSDSGTAPEKKNNDSGDKSKDPPPAKDTNATGPVVAYLPS